MQEFNFLIQNKTSTTAILKNLEPPLGGSPSEWEKELPTTIRMDDKGTGKLNVDAGYRQAGFMYEATEQRGTVQLRFGIIEGEERMPQAISSDPKLVKAKVVVGNGRNGVWSYAVNWAHIE